MSAGAGAMPSGTVIVRPLPLLLPVWALLLSLPLAARIEVLCQRRREGKRSPAARRAASCRLGALAAAAGAATSSWRLLAARQRCIRN